MKYEQFIRKIVNVRQWRTKFAPKARPVKYVILSLLKRKYAPKNPHRRFQHRYTQGDLTPMFPTFLNPILNFNFYFNADPGSS